MAAEKKRKRLGLVIGAGSVKCAAALGVLQVLEEEGIAVDLLVGASGGSLMAAVSALGYDADTATEMTKNMWTRDLSKRRNRGAIFDLFFPKARGFKGEFGLVDDTIILKQIRRAFGGATFADAKTPLFITATDFLTGEQVILKDGSLVDAIRASIAIPFVFKPWSVNGRMLVDAFLSDPMPINVAIQEGADIILAMGFESSPAPRVKSVVNYAFQITTIMSGQLMRANYAFHNLAHHAEILPLIPDFEERIGWFDTEKIPYLIDKGTALMKEHVPYLKQLLHLDNAAE